MKKLIFLFISAFSLILTSCEKVIDIGVSDTEPKLVIEALYDAVDEKVSVNISKTVNVFEATDYFPTVSGATVKIIDENDVSFTLNDEGEGRYSLENYSPIYNSLYRLQVTLDGITYEAQDSLMPIVPIDSLRFEYQEGSLFFEEGYFVFYEFSDPLDVNNFYKVRLNLNGEDLIKPSDQMLFVNGPNNSSSQSIPIYWQIFQNNDSLQVDLISYSQRSYFYYSDFFSLLSNSPVVAAPANPRVQWTNDTDDEIECLGHFTAFGYDRKSIVVQE